jgi:hypothetical protein
MSKSLMFSLLGLAMFASAAQADIVRLGSVRLENNSDRVTILSNTCGVNRIHAIVRGQRAHIRAIIVDYRAEGAERTRFPINRTLLPGQSTGWLDLPGNVRCVTRVVVAGESLGNLNPSRVDIYANRPAGSVENRVIGRARLGEGFSFSHVNVSNVCNIEQVRLRVDQDSARIDYISVRFANGSSQRLNVRANFAEGSTSVWKDLPGKNRCIRSFTVVGASSSHPRDAIVTLIGR